MSDAADAVAITERRGQVLIVTMNRPRALNVFDEAMADALIAVFEGLADDASIRAVILAGAGRSFMAGGDLARFHADLVAAPKTAAALIDQFHRLARLIKAAPQPVIAAVQGPVAGGGVSLALMCDFVVAAQDASFLSAYTKLGTSPDGGLTWTLSRLLGPRRALEFVLLNEAINASDALRLGLVNRVVPGEELGPAALALAERLAGASRGAGGAAKALVRAAGAQSFDAQLDCEKENFVANAGSADFREGVSAFFDRRRPRFE